MNFWIDQREIGPDRPVLVIAEIGVNHDGSLARALQLVDVAREAGADCVKLQVFCADQLMHSSSAFAGYQQDRCAEATPADMLRRYEFSEGQQAQIVDAIRRAGLIPLATPFSLGDVQTIARLHLPAIKIASPDLVNGPLLAACAKLNKPLLVSTGAATMEEVRAAVERMKSFGVPLALLHCISSYPVSSESAQLGWIAELSAATNAIVGYSDHTTEVVAGALSVSSGACIVEKHLTYDRKAPGPDHSASADPVEFKEYVRVVRLAQAMRGEGKKRVLSIEQDVRTVSRQSLVLCRAVTCGQVITEADLIIQRPGTGIPAGLMDRVIGVASRVDLPPGTMLAWDMLAERN